MARLALAFAFGRRLGGAVFGSSGREPLADPLDWEDQNSSGRIYYSTRYVGTSRLGWLPVTDRHIVMASVAAVLLRVRDCLFWGLGEDGFGLGCGMCVVVVRW